MGMETWGTLQWTLDTSMQQERKVSRPNWTLLQTAGGHLLCSSQSLANTGVPQGNTSVLDTLVTAWDLCELQVSQLSSSLHGLLSRVDIRELTACVLQ